jgi:hypothetical protein
MLHHLLTWALLWMTVPAVFAWAAWQAVDTNRGRCAILLVFGAWGLSMWLV